MNCKTTNTAKVCAHVTRTPFFVHEAHDAPMSWDITSFSGQGSIYLLCPQNTPTATTTTTTTNNNNNNNQQPTTNDQ